MAALEVDPRTIQAFANEAAFTRWLAKNHDRERELYLRIYKNASGVHTVSYREAVVVALCWGWIDGVKKALDEQSYLQRFCPRGARSIWSKINREQAERLIADGRMQPSGLAQVEAAKADGRWANAYAGSATMVMPEDLMQAIEANAKARAAYQTLDKVNRYALAFRLGKLKTEAARTRKLAEFVAMLARGERIHEKRTQPERAKPPRGR